MASVLGMIRPSPHACWGCPPQSCFSPAHLGLVQRLSLGLALQGDLLILSTDFINDAVQVQVPVVVHGQDDRHIADVGLDLSDLLHGKQGWSQDLTVRG